MDDAQGPSRREEDSFIMPELFYSAIKIVNEVLDLDSDSWSALRLCSRGTRVACDTGVPSLQVMYGSEQPGMRPPESMEKMQQSLRGVLSRGCKPSRLTLQLDVSPDNEAKGLAVLDVFSDVRSLKQLNLHGLRLNTDVAQPVQQDHPVPNSIIESVASLTRVRTLSLVVAISSEEALADALTILADGLPGLRGLSLTARALPDDLLKRLPAAWPQLESLSLSAAGSQNSLEHVSTLLHFTALTHLSLGYPLSAVSVQQAMNDGAWGLPPRLRELHLNTPLSALQLARLAVPPTLHTVTLGPGAKLQLPARLEETAEAVAALKPKVAAWHLTHLAFQDCIRSLRNPTKHYWWIPQLGPMRLHSLELNNMHLFNMDVSALADALSPTLEELKLQRCLLISLPHTLAAFLHLSCLRTLILAGSAALDGAGEIAAGNSRLEGLMLIPRLRSQAALVAQAAAGVAPFNAAAERAEAAVRAMEAAVERLALRNLEWLDKDERSALLEATLLLLLARRVDVQIETNPFDVSRIRRGSNSMLDAISSEGAGAEWGRFELVECDH